MKRLVFLDLWFSQLYARGIFGLSFATGFPPYRLPNDAFEASQTSTMMDAQYSYISIQPTLEEESRGHEVPRDGRTGPYMCRV